MPKVNKTINNPYGLTAKQDLMIEGIVQNVKDGKSLKAGKVVNKVYNTKSQAVAESIASENLKKPNIRAALIDRLTKRGVIGVDGKVENTLVEGLDSIKSDVTGQLLPDYQTRLKYAQEINKITGVYAPTKTENKNLNLNTTLSNEELEAKLQGLIRELEE